MTDVAVSDGDHDAKRGSIEDIYFSFLVQGNRVLLSCIDQNGLAYVAAFWDHFDLYIATAVPDLGADKDAIVSARLRVDFDLWRGVLSFVIWAILHKKRGK